MISCMIFIVGTIIGSFLNVCIFRIPRGESIVYPPSHCTKCKNKIKAYDLIPIVSYIILRGRCRSCKTKISIRYPIIEFLVGLIFVLLFHIYGLSLTFIKYSTLISILIVVALIDYDTTDIYLSTILIGIIFSIGFICVYAYIGIPVKSYIYGGILGGGMLLLISLLTHGNMGLGDVEIFLVCGLFFGIELTILMMLLAFIIGSFCASILVLSGKKSRKDYIAFGPYILMASIICSVFGENIFKFMLFAF